MSQINTLKTLGPDQPEYFQAMFAESDDPWHFKTRWYEKRKRDLTLACLPAERYVHGFEPGCANGELSAALASRSDRLLVSDGIGSAVVLAKHRLKDFQHVEVRKAWLPNDWPCTEFDLIVLSEFLFYAKRAVVEQIALKAQHSLAEGGVILACHWRHPIEGCELKGDQVHEALQQHIRLPNQCHVIEPDLILDVWSNGPTLAAKESIY